MITSVGTRVIPNSVAVAVFSSAFSFTGTSCVSIALATPGCDLGLVGYESTLLVRRVGAVLTPTTRQEIQRAAIG